MHVYITGGAASGKKTLAWRLQSELGIPAFNLNFAGLDMVAGADGPSRAAEIRAIAARPDWAAAGTHGVEFTPLAEAADHIVLLDPPWRVAAWRIPRRYLAAELSGHNHYHGLRRLWQFFWRSRRFYLDEPQPWYSEEGDPRTRTAAVEMLRPYAAKVTTCRTTADVDAFVARLCAGTR